MNLDIHNQNKIPFAVLQNLQTCWR